MIIRSGEGDQEIFSLVFSGVKFFSFVPMSDVSPAPESAAHDELTFSSHTAALMQAVSWRNQGWQREPMPYTSPLFRGGAVQ